MTIVKKVEDLIKESKRALSLKEIYEKLPSHSHSSIRGNINRAVAKKTTSLIRKEPGIYTIIEIISIEDNHVNYSVNYYANNKEIHVYHTYNVDSSINDLTSNLNIQNGIYENVTNSNNFSSLENHFASIQGIFETGDVKDILSKISDNSFDLLCTDPPYKVISGGTGGKNSPKGILSKNDGKIFKYNDIKVAEWLPECYRLLKDGSQAYIFTNFLNLKELMNEAEKVGFKMHNLLVWEKNNATPNRWGMKNCEYVLLLRKGKAKPLKDCSFKTVHKFKNIIKNKMHETEKPIDLLRTYIRNSTEIGDYVLDPFAGSGSTAEACLLEGRKFFTCEIDEKYFNTINSRLIEAFSYL